MAIVFMDGFDLYNGTGANTGAQTRWVYGLGLGGGGSFSMTAGRYGGQAMRFTSLNSFSNAYSYLPGAYNSLTVAFAFRVATLGSFQTIAWFGLNNATQLAFTVIPGGIMEAFRGSSGNSADYGATWLGGSGAGKVFANTWHFAEISMITDNSAGAVTIRLDGATILTLTGQDTQAQGGPGINTLKFGTSGSGAMVDIDDVYVLDSTTPIGERRIETLRPNADTATKTWTPNTGSTNYTQVDEATADGDGTFVQSSSVGDVDLYELSDLATSPTTIDAVRPVVFAEKTDAATRQLAIRYSSGGTAGDGAAINLAMSYNAYGPDIYAADPHDAAAWTTAKVNALKIGPKVAG